MKMPLLFLALGNAVALGGAAAESLPEPVPMERYAALVEHSPFAPATAAATPTPKVESPSFTKDYYVTGMARLGNASVVTIFSRDKAQRFSLAVGETFNGITLAGVEWADQAGKGTATLKKGTEFGTIGFDEAAMKPPPIPVAPASPAPGARPGAPNPGNNPYAAIEERQRRGAWGERMRSRWRERWNRERGGGPSDGNGGRDWRRNRPIPNAPRQ